MWIRLAITVVVAGFVLIVAVASFRYGVMSENARCLRISAEAGAKYAETAARQQARVDQLMRDLDAERRRFKVKREEVIRVISTDPPSVEWASVRIPDGVRDSLRGAAMPADSGSADGAVSVDGAEARD